MLGVVFLVAMALPTMGSVIAHFLFGPLGLDSQVKWIFSLIRVVLPLIIILILFTILYSVAPNVKTKLKSVLPGAIFTSVIWLLGLSHLVSTFQILETTLRLMAVSQVLLSY